MRTLTRWIAAFAVALGSSTALSQVPLPVPNITIKAQGLVYAAAVQADGKVVIGGFFESVAGVAKSNIARVNADGTLDQTFTASVTGTVSAIAISGTDIYIGGTFTQVNGTARENLARITMADAKWPSLSSAPRRSLWPVRRRISVHQDKGDFAVAAAPPSSPTGSAP